MGQLTVALMEAGGDAAHPGIARACELCTLGRAVDRQVLANVPDLAAAVKANCVESAVEKHGPPPPNHWSKVLVRSSPISCASVSEH